MDIQTYMHSFLSFLKQGFSKIITKKYDYKQKGAHSKYIKSQDWQNYLRAKNYSLYTMIHKMQEASFIKFYAEQSSLLLSFRLKLKTSLLSFHSLSNEFNIFTVL